MGSIHEANDGTVTIRNRNGESITFSCVAEFLDYLAEWQEHIVFHMAKFEPLPDNVWMAYAEANRN